MLRRSSMSGRYAHRAFKSSRTTLEIRRSHPFSNTAPLRSDLTRNAYASRKVPIPSKFLTTKPADAHPVTAERVNFDSALPEYSAYYATVIDNVLSASECAELLRLAEMSSPTGDWQPAFVNVGLGYEKLRTDIRHCDRIVWDNAEVVKRIWARCLEADGIEDELGRIENQPNIQDDRAIKKGEKWRMVKVNERMRFLRYGAGNYFKRHVDGTYESPDGDTESFYTLQLYLNDSIWSGGDVKGGATTFHSRDMKRRVDVYPEMGRVLIFQHAHLLHSGDEVQEGVKYTMRSDLMYKRL